MIINNYYLEGLFIMSENTLQRAEEGAARFSGGRVGCEDFRDRQNDLKQALRETP
jgi:hypothetical protein